MSNATSLSENCIHCGNCTRTCGFLKKHNIDLAGFAQREDLAYHCFLCGECAAVCPKQIDGRAIALTLREAQVTANGDRVKEKGYGALIAEKKDYLFKNYKKGKKSVLFPGCNFPSFFPKTTDHLIALLGKAADVGVVFDCCGKPIFELGMERAAEEGLQALKQRLHDAGVEEIVILCPNCYYFLKPCLTEFSVVNIYDKLRELGLGDKLCAEKANIFVPCPDKETKELESAFLPFLAGEWENIPDVQCCGLGGCAAGKEPELAQGFRDTVREQNCENVYAYCASCAGCLSRSGVEQVHHVLVELLGTGEQPVTSAATVWNRAKRKSPSKADLSPFI